MQRNVWEIREENKTNRDDEMIQRTFGEHMKKDKATYFVTKGISPEERLARFTSKRIEIIS